MTARAALGAGIALLALLVGCSGGSDEADAVPEGFRVYQGDGFTLATPEGWRRTSGDERLNPEVDVEFVKGDDESDAPAQIFVAATRQRPGHTVDSYVTLLFGVGQLGVPESEIVDQERAEVPGAQEALLVEFSYLEDRIRQPVEVREWAVVARVGRRFYELRMVSPERRFDEELFRQVIDTFEVGL